MHLFNKVLRYNNYEFNENVKLNSVKRLSLLTIWFWYVIVEFFKQLSSSDQYIGTPVVVLIREMILDRRYHYFFLFSIKIPRTTYKERIGTKRI